MADKPEVVIVVDAGHGGFGVTPGKRTPDGEYEWNFNNLNVIGFQEEMSKYEGVRVVRLDDPTGRRDVPLRERTQLANSLGAILLLSFHHNAITGQWGTWGGTETYAFNGSRSYMPTELEWARIIHDACLRSYKLRNRGIKRANFHMLRESNMPSVLLEGGFMDSTTDIKVMRQDPRVREYGREVARSVAKQLGLKLKSGNVSTPVTPSSPVNRDSFHRVQVGAFKDERNASDLASKVRRDGFESYIVRSADYIRVQLGAFANKQNADNLLKRVKDAGYKDAFITHAVTASIPKAEPINEPRDMVLDVNGNFFTDVPTIKRLQNHYGTPETGEISEPPARSMLLEAMQRDFGSPPTGQVTRNGESALWGAMQLALGTPHTKKISDTGSELIKEVQRQLNAGTFPNKIGPRTPTAKPINKGDRVRVNQSAVKYATGQNIPARIKGNVFTVEDVKNGQVLLREIMSWVHNRDVTKL